MSLKQKLEENRRIVILCVIFFAILIFTYVLFGATVMEKWPSEGKIQDKIDELKKAQKDLQVKLDEDNWRIKNRESFITNNKNFWIPARDGVPEANAQKRIEEAAEAAGLKLQTIGKVNPSTVADGILQMDISITAKAPIGQTAAFIEQIYKRSPRFYWAVISLGPDNLRDPREVTINGTLRFISITDAEIAEKLLNDKILVEKDAEPANKLPGEQIPGNKNVEPQKKQPSPIPPGNKNIAPQKKLPNEKTPGDKHETKKK